MEESQSQSYAEDAESTAYGWLSLLSYTTQYMATCPGVALSTVSWPLRHQSLIKATSHRLFTGQSWGHFLTKESLFSDVSTS